jgi:hypothetical protein
VVKQFSQLLVEVAAPAGQLGKLQPPVVPVVVEMDQDRRTTTMQVPRAPPVRVFQVEMVSLMSSVPSSPQVVEVVPEVPVVQEAAFMPVMVVTDAPRRLLEHVFSMPAAVVVVTTAATQLPITEQALGPPVTVVKEVVEMVDNQLPTPP